MGWAKRFTSSSILLQLYNLVMKKYVLTRKQLGSTTPTIPIIGSGNGLTPSVQAILLSQ
ncbi:hypothetical protein Bhyg_04367 [Pseudolycoriella hygida]|uniref:Uncharacterized protein n=1 Tax=Pseudolycoriella hygida TaxID=35572 RepID=A0A9Q0S8A9_9DIPT|nr:hypothetical protein Bhyg_04367 [Pseudolycoriella hygida]